MLRDALITLEGLGAFAYLAIFLIALADSTMVVGTFTAGGAFLLVAGALTAHGAYDLSEMAAFAGVGAFLGGLASYQLGRAEARFARRKRWFPKEKHLERGAAMLAKRGGFALLIARFLGPLSSIMAFVAGTARMPLHRFLFWNGISAFLWAAAFILAGRFLGSSLLGPLPS